MEPDDGSLEAYSKREVAFERKFAYKILQIGFSSGFTVAKTESQKVFLQDLILVVVFIHLLVSGEQYTQMIF